MAKAQHRPINVLDLAALAFFALPLILSTLMVAFGGEVAR